MNNNVNVRFYPFYLILEVALGLGLVFVDGGDNDDNKQFYQIFYVLLQVPNVL